MAVEQGFITQAAWSAYLNEEGTVSLALGLCFLIWGHSYPSYHKKVRFGNSYPHLHQFL